MKKTTFFLIALLACTTVFSQSQAITDGGQSKLAKPARSFADRQSMKTIAFGCAFSGRLQTGDISLPAREFIFGDISTCTHNVPFQGTNANGPYLYDFYRYTNTSANTACVTVYAGGLQNYVTSFSYLNCFNPANLSTNRLGTLGQAWFGGQSNYSFNLGAGETAVIAIVAFTNTVQSDYLLDIESTESGFCQQLDGLNNDCSIVSVPANDIFTGGDANVIYLGYGPQSTTLQVTPSSGATYSWSPSTGLSSTTSSAPVFTPVAAGSYTITVTVTTGGCATTCSITICVVDVRVPGTKGKKIYVCHVPPGNPANEHTNEISENAVATHLAHGDRLGNCDQTPCGSSQKLTQKAQPDRQLSKDLQLSVFPNPSNGAFTITTRSEASELTSIRIMDVYGRVVLVQNNVQPNAPLRLGEKLQKGTYFVEVTQGTIRRSMTITKSN